MTSTQQSTRTIEAICLEHLALDEADLRARLAELEADAITYRELLCESIHALHDVTRERDRSRASRRELQQAYDALRADRDALRRDLAHTREALRVCQLGRVA